MRFLSTSAKLAFRSQSVAHIKSTPKVASVAKDAKNQANSFKSFKEYRLKIVNQSPLNRPVLDKVRSRAGEK